MSVMMLVIRSRGGGAFATRCTFFSLRSGLNRIILRVQPTPQQDRYKFALKSGYDEQAPANSHNIFQCGNNQVGNFEGLHQSGTSPVTTERADKRAHNPHDAAYYKRLRSRGRNPRTT